MVLQSIDVLGLSKRAWSVLHYNGIEYIEECAEYTEHELYLIRCMGRKSVKEIKNTMSDIGLKFKPNGTNT